MTTITDKDNQLEFDRIQKKCGDKWTLDMIKNWLFYSQSIETATNMLDYMKKNYNID